MKFTAYTFAAMDFLPVCFVCSLTLLGLVAWNFILPPRCDDDDDTS